MVLEDRSAAGSGLQATVSMLTAARAADRVRLHGNVLQAPGTKPAPSPSFGIADYWRMFRARGPRLPISYFLNCQLFDWRHGTDTHARLMADGYDPQFHGIDQGHAYMCSWTGEIRRMFRELRTMLGDEFASHGFVDVGCGKGKVVLVWRQECERLKLAQAIHGIEHYAPLLDIARDNYRRVFADEGSFVLGDATSEDFSRFGNRLILYLYNPFGEPILRRMLSRLPGLQVFIVYNNPVHARVIEAAGFRVCFEGQGYHPNARTSVFSNVGAGRQESPGC
jgi:hypothetical protein